MDAQGPLPARPRRLDVAVRLRQAEGAALDRVTLATFYLFLAASLRAPWLLTCLPDFLGSLRCMHVPLCLVPRRRAPCWLAGQRVTAGAAFRGRGRPRAGPRGAQGRAGAERGREQAGAAGGGWRGQLAKAVEPPDAQGGRRTALSVTAALRV